MVKVGTWHDYYMNQDRWTPFNATSDGIIKLSDTNTEKDVSNIKENKNLVALTLDPITSDPLLVIGGNLLMKGSYVALHDFEPNANVVRFKSSEDLFG